MFVYVSFSSVVSFSQAQDRFFYSYAKVQEKNVDSLSFSLYLQNEENLYLLKFRLVHQLEDLMQRTHMGYALNNRPEQLADSTKLFPRFIFSSDKELQSSVVGGLDGLHMELVLHLLPRSSFTYQLFLADAARPLLFKSQNIAPAILLLEFCAFLIGVLC